MVEGDKYKWKIPTSKCLCEHLRDAIGALSTKNQTQMMGNSNNAPERLSNGSPQLQPQYSTKHIYWGPSGLIETAYQRRHYFNLMYIIECVKEAREGATKTLPLSTDATKHQIFQKWQLTRIQLTQILKVSYHTSSKSKNPGQIPPIPEGRFAYREENFLIWTALSYCYYKCYRNIYRYHQRITHSGVDWYITNIINVKI